MCFLFVYKSFFEAPFAANKKGYVQLKTCGEKLRTLIIAVTHRGRFASYNDYALANRRSDPVGRTADRRYPSIVPMGASWWLG
jgi:hypothetical protein